MKWFTRATVLVAMHVLVFSLCEHAAMGQGITVEDIIDDFGPLLELPPLKPSATPGGTKPGAPPVSSNANRPSPGSRPAAGTSPGGSQPALPGGSPGGNTATGGKSGGSPIVYEGDMAQSARLNFESFHEQVTGELLKLVGLGFLQLTSREVDVNVTAGKMRMVVDGNTVSIDPVTVTIDVKWKYSTSTGGKSAGKNRITWTFQCNRTQFFADSPFHDKLTLSAKDSSKKAPAKIRGVWSATPLSGDRYNVVLVLNPPAAADLNPEQLIYAAFSTDPRKWEADRRETATETEGIINLPAYPKNGKPRWILRRVDGGGKTTGGTTSSGGSATQGSQGATQGQPNASDFSADDDTGQKEDADNSQAPTETPGEKKTDGPPTFGEFFADNDENPKGGTPPKDEAEEDLDILGQKTGAEHLCPMIVASRRVSIS